MNPHPFIFTPGVWEGEGTISFSMAEDILKFKMSWTVLPLEDEKIYFSQVVDIDSFTDKMHNNFTVSSITPSTFEIALENNIVGKVFGQGVIDSNAIGWEFRAQDQEFEGYEIYELQPDGSYHMRAEFTAGDGLRTHIRGHIERPPQ